PTVILDSFAHSAPALASNIGGIGELVSEKFLFESNDSADFLEKINWCLVYKDKIIEEGVRGREFVEKLTIEDYIDTVNF
ncbi:MAG: hypothetical protein HQ536_00005, partial [Parcubacteria group bacterium]|nr:hypothetical protein [Parcubacteria group bacterium]